MKQKIKCPVCGKWLVSIETDTKGIIYIWCRKCRQEVKIKID